MNEFLAAAGLFNTTTDLFPCDTHIPSITVHFGEKEFTLEAEVNKYNSKMLDSDWLNFRMFYYVQIPRLIDVKLCWEKIHLSFLEFHFSKNIV